MDFYWASEKVSYFYSHSDNGYSDWSMIHRKAIITIFSKRGAIITEML